MYGQNPQGNTAPQPPPPVNAQQQPNPSAGTAKKGGSKTMMYGIGVIVIIVVIAVVVLMVQKPSTSSNPLYSMLSSNKTMPLKTFAQAVDSKFNSTSQLNISYSGRALAKMESGGVNVTLNMPLSIDLMKYGSNGRVNANVSDIPFIGNLTVIAILNNSEMYTCSKSAFGGALGLNSTSSNSSSYTCQEPVSTSGFVNSTYINALNGSIHFTSVTQSSYKGNGCTLASGYMDINSSALTNATSAISSLSSSILPTTNVNASFSMCLSDTYYIPLTMSLNETINTNSSSLGAAGTVHLQLNETSLSTSVSPSITALPGPVVNTTASGLV